MNFDPLDISPIREGLIPSQVGTKAIEKKKIFQFDENQNFYLSEKINSFAHGSELFIQVDSDLKIDLPQINKKIIEFLLASNPEFQVESNNQGERLMSLDKGEILSFKNGKLIGHRFHRDVPDLFFALGLITQEDLVILRVGENQSRVAGAHLILANGWSAKTAIGQSVEEIHRPVPQIDQVISSKALNRFFKRICEKDLAYDRIGAISLRTRIQLCEHPDVVNLKDPERIRFLADQPKLLARFERQSLSSLGGSYVLFAIKTYYQDIIKLSHARQLTIFESILNANEKIYSFPFINSNRLELEKYYRLLKYF